MTVKSIMTIARMKPILCVGIALAFVASLIACENKPRHVVIDDDYVRLQKALKLPSKFEINIKSAMINYNYDVGPINPFSIYDLQMSTGTLSKISSIFTQKVTEGIQGQSYYYAFNSIMENDISADKIFILTNELNKMFDIYSNNNMYLFLLKNDHMKGIYLYLDDSGK